MVYNKKLGEDKSEVFATIWQVTVDVLMIDKANEDLGHFYASATRLSSLSVNFICLTIVQRRP